MTKIITTWTRIKTIDKESSIGLADLAYEVLKRSFENTEQFEAQWLKPFYETLIQLQLLTPWQQIMWVWRSAAQNVVCNAGKHFRNDYRSYITKLWYNGRKAFTTVSCYIYWPRLWDLRSAIALQMQSRDWALKQCPYAVLFGINGLT